MIRKLTTCSNCGKRCAIKRVIKLKEYTYYGCQIQIPNYSYDECLQCKERTFDAKELDRWKTFLPEDCQEAIRMRREKWKGILKKSDSASSTES